MIVHMSMFSALATMRVIERLNTPGDESPKMSLQVCGCALIAVSFMYTPAHLWQGVKGNNASKMRGASDTTLTAAVDPQVT